MWKEKDFFLINWVNNAWKWIIITCNEWEHVPWGRTLRNSDRIMILWTVSKCLSVLWKLCVKVLKLSEFMMHVIKHLLSVRSLFYNFMLWDTRTFHGTCVWKIHEKRKVSCQTNNIAFYIYTYISHSQRKSSSILLPNYTWRVFDYNSCFL